MRQQAVLRTTKLTHNGSPAFLLTTTIQLPRTHLIKLNIHSRLLYVINMNMAPAPSPLPCLVAWTCDRRSACGQHAVAVVVFDGPNAPSNVRRTDSSLLRPSNDSVAGHEVSSEGPGIVLALAALTP